MYFGKGKGCAFLTDDCIDRTTKKAAFSEFCDTDMDLLCSPDRKGFGICWTKTYTEDIPAAYNYFSNRTGGLNSFSDYCPIAGYIPSEYDQYSCSQYTAGFNPNAFNDWNYEAYGGPESQCVMGSLYFIYYFIYLGTWTIGTAPISKHPGCLKVEVIYFSYYSASRTQTTKILIKLKFISMQTSL